MISIIPYGMSLYVMLVSISIKMIWERLGQFGNSLNAFGAFWDRMGAFGSLGGLGSIIPYVCMVCK